MPAAVAVEITCAGARGKHYQNNCRCEDEEEGEGQEGMGWGARGGGRGGINVVATERVAREEVSRPLSLDGGARGASGSAWKEGSRAPSQFG